MKRDTCIGFQSDINNTIIQYGSYVTTTPTGTVTFPTSFASTNIKIVAGTNTNNASAYPYPDKFPYDVTRTGFTREKSNATLTASYIAIGY